MQHATRLGLNGRSNSTDLAPMQAYNWVGITNIYAPVALPGDPTLTSLNTDSRERALAGYATLTSDLSPSVQSFVGARITRLNRSSEQSDGSRAVSFEQTVTTPWAGLAWSPSASAMLYVSWGQGVELEVGAQSAGSICQCWPGAAGAQKRANRDRPEMAGRCSACC